MTSYTIEEQYPVISRLTLTSIGGHHIEYAPTETIRSCFKSYEKESVDDGCFIPGVYRVNPYVVSKETFNVQELNVRLLYPAGYWTYIHEDSGPIGAGALEQASNDARGIEEFGTMPQRAIQAAYSKITENDIGAGENLGELTQTINLFRHPFRDLREFFWNRDFYNVGVLQKLRHYLVYREYGRHSGVDAAKAASNAWLEFRYGLMPLIYTAQDIIGQVNKKCELFDGSRIRSKHVKLVKTVPRHFVVGPFSNFGIVYKGYAQCNNKLKVTAAVQYKQEFPLSTAEILGLTPRFIPELAWELTRLSFVVDWWFTVGPWLGSLRRKPYVKILGNTVGHRLSKTITMSGTGKVQNDASASYESVGAFGVYRHDRYERLVDVDLPMLPQLDLDYRSYFHAIDSVSLILQQVLKKLR